MEPLTVLLIVLGVVIAAVVVVWTLLPFLRNKGVDVGAVLRSARDVATAANKAVDIVRPFLPQSAGLTFVDRIMDIAKIGVCQAEQLYHIGQLPADQRKTAATAYIHQALGLAGIEVTDDVRRLVDGAIEANVLALGHKARPPDGE